MSAIERCYGYVLLVDGVAGNFNRIDLTSFYHLQVIDSIGQVEPLGNCLDIVGF